ncbi:reverse transcriptase (RNA-dependent DNA polymerase) domain-containing protein [Phthorimaea operculella]|nr:reverse transcriptase (RNA-dependent DNA polymerase) domain-containing protein [Phthorimaea operculella]
MASKVVEFNGMEGFWQCNYCYRNVVPTINNRTLTGFEKCGSSHKYIISVMDLNLRNWCGIKNFSKSFLSGRKQLVEVTTNGRKYRSVAGDVTVGIPQGSSLGNTLFLTFINDLSHFITEGLVVLFADDTTVILCARTNEELNTKITCTYNKLQEWFSSNGLILNASKSNLILFSAKSIEKPLSINSPVPICPSCKFLGFTLDPNLNWKIHVQTLCDRLTGAAYALRKLRPVVSSSVLKQTYFAHFQSLMSYGILLWGTSVDSERVFILQKRAIRIMANIGPRETCRTRFSKFRVMTMTNLYLFELLSYVRRNIASFSRRSAGDRLLRNTGRLATVRRRTEIATKNPRVIGPTYYERLPANLKNEISDEIFYRQLKNLLLENEFYTIKEFLAFKFL